MQQPEAAIFDIGYARYGGSRGGRMPVVAALYASSLRAAFGFGRKWTAKITPFVLCLITLLPALAQLAIAALADNIVEVFRPEEYYGYIQWVLVLFVSATATDLVGRDRQHRVLVLYLARGMERPDYVLAKVAALATALLGLTLGPQALLFVGNGLALEDPAGYLRDEWRDVPAILVTAAGVSLAYSCLALVVAAATPRRSFAAGTIIGAFAVTAAIAGVATQFGDGLVRELAPLSSGFHLLNGFTLWAFNADPDPGSVVDRSGLALGWFAIALAVATGAGFAYLLRYYRSLRL